MNFICLCPKYSYKILSMETGWTVCLICKITGEVRHITETCDMNSETTI